MYLAVWPPPALVCCSLIYASRLSVCTEGTVREIRLSLARIRGPTALKISGCEGAGLRGRRSKSLTDPAESISKQAGLDPFCYRELRRVYIRCFAWFLSSEVVDFVTFLG